MTEEGDQLIIVRSTFPKFQEYYTVTMQLHNTGSSTFNINPAANPAAPKVSGKFYVGNYFTERGEFYEVSNFGYSV